MADWLNQLWADIGGGVDAFRNALAPPPRPIWNPDNPIGTETMQTVGMPAPTVYAGPVGEIVNPTTGQLTTRGQEHVAADPWLGFDTGGLSAGGLMGAVERARMKSGPVDIQHPMRPETVTAFVNPSPSDLARMMQASLDTPHLRVLQEGPNVAVWPALDATHLQMREPLGFSKDAKYQDYRYRVGEPDDEFPHKAGRFSFWAAEH